MNKHGSYFKQFHNRGIPFFSLRPLFHQSEANSPMHSSHQHLMLINSRSYIHPHPY